MLLAISHIRVNNKRWDTRALSDKEKELYSYEMNKKAVEAIGYKVKENRKAVI